MGHDATLPVEAILAFFDLPAHLVAAPYGSGLINRTYALSDDAEPRYVLQEINTRVFREPGIIDANLRVISSVFREQHPDYVFTHPVASPGGETQYVHPGSGRCFRIFEFIANSISHLAVPDARAAYEGARQFGLFAHRLGSVPMTRIRPSIPQFHDLALRVQQFERSLRDGNQARIGACQGLITRAHAHMRIARDFAHAVNTGTLQQRLMHHDTKISNALFDATTLAGVCVVDLDTVMPGTFLSDAGDMVRTYVCPVDENHPDPDDIHVRPDIYAAIEAGYLEHMGAALSGEERTLFTFAGEFMIYMQALRFLTDYFNDDVYYGAAYPTHNLDRATNQMTLLERYIEFVDARGR